MKRILSLFAAFAVMLSLSACQAEDTGQNIQTSEAAQNTVTASENVEVVSESLIEQLTETNDITSEIISAESNESKIENNTLTLGVDIYPIESEEIVLSINSAENKYTYIDLSNLTQYTKLKKLEILNMNDVYNPIRLINYDTLLESSSLEEITVYMISFDYNVLSQVKSLKILNINWYTTDDWSFLKELNQVQELNLYRCNIKDVGFINEMTSLSHLALQNTPIQNFEDIETNTLLKEMQLIENELTTLSGIDKFENLEYLYISECYIDEMEQELYTLKNKLPACDIEANYEKQ